MKGVLKMKINEIEYNLNLLDADIADRIEAAAQELVDELNGRIEELKQMSAAKSIREQCRLIDVFFDAVLGDGSANAIFGGKSDLEAHLEVYGRFMAGLSAERDQRLAAATSRLVDAVPASGAAQWAC